ncbi:hypothetical protein [Bartonella sp. MU70NMGDW]|uniref:hypothetical protein n=1 Tax=Bartonella sp. MU70NMGDW TaxID=3243561 RepID=UPI0035D06C67
MAEFHWGIEKPAGGMLRGAVFVFSGAQYLKDALKDAVAFSLCEGHCLNRDTA